MGWYHPISESHIASTLAYPSALHCSAVTPGTRWVLLDFYTLADAAGSEPKALVYKNCSSQNVYCCIRS